jgi:hypothetical protein
MDCSRTLEFFFGSLKPLDRSRNFCAIYEPVPPKRDGDAMKVKGNLDYNNKKITRCLNQDIEQRTMI